MEEKVGKEEEVEENKKIVKEAVALMQHARSNPSIIYDEVSDLMFNSIVMC